tara:strand:+ start:860 stop:1117 length:258 start_codon:yes stop_codon:yes gene_type:complete
MNAPGLLELVIILFLAWAFLGPQKMAKGAKTLGKAYSEFRGYTSGNNKLPKNDKIRSSAERLGIDTAGMNQTEIKEAIMKELSNK